MDRRQRWAVLSGFAAELTVLAWAIFAFDLPLEALLVLGAALALSLSTVRIVRPGWYGLAVAWIFLAVASQWYFGRYVSQELALLLGFALAGLVIAVVSPGYHAVRKLLVRTEQD